VAPADSNAAAAAATGPWVRKVLRLALLHHPIPTLTFCFGCLGTSGRNSSSSTVGPAVLQGVRLWLREHILREASPSREGTPMDCDGSGSGGGAASCSAAALAAAAAAGAAGVGNGAHTSSKAGAAAAAAAAGGMPLGPGQQRSSVLQAVLESSAELRAWIRQEAKGVSRGETTHMSYV
jgi:hypothetical protein